MEREKQRAIEREQEKIAREEAEKIKKKLEEEELARLKAEAGGEPIPPPKSKFVSHFILTLTTDVTKSPNHFVLTDKKAAICTTQFFILD